MSASDPFDEFLEEDADRNDDLIPSVDIPEPDASGGGLDSAAVGLFWRLVLVFNVALFGVTVGPMILYFRRELLMGGGLLAVGVLAGVYGVVRYRRFERERNDGK